MAIAVITGASVQLAAAWTGTAPGPGAPTVSGTLSSASDISAYCQSVGVEVAAATQDGTTFADGGYTVNFAGLKSGNLTLNLLNDYATTKLDEIIQSTLGGVGASVYYDVKSTSSARGTSNPSYVGKVIVTDWKPITVQVGNLVVVQVSWPITGSYARLTA